MELNIGSNIIRNTSGVLRVEEREQIFLELGERDRQLLLTMDIYDSVGNHIAKLRRNAWTFNEQDRFTVTTHPSSLRLVDTTSDDLIVEANVISEDRIAVPHGRFYTHQGHLVEITPEFWRINGSLTMSGNTLEGGGGAVAIG